VLVNRALVRVHRRALGAALADAREALEQSRAMLGEQHVDTAQAQIALGRVLLAQGRRSGALSWLQAGLQGLRARLPAEHWQVGVAESVLGHALGREPARRAEALALLRQGYERVLRARGPSAVATRDAARRLNELVVASDRSGAQPGRTRARR
jgi:tetratricopeptide (TPR) repeat protein